jgi:AcrR family transcriptional regulator
LLASKGYAAFTTRAVATAAGIKPGNLAYHYRTKRDLLRAVITAMVADYAQQIEQFFENNPPDSTDGFAKLVAWLIHDSITPYTSRLFRELWAMALHDPFVAKAIDSFYDECFARVAELLRASQPALSSQRAIEIVCLLGMICEGANPIFGTAGRKGGSVDKVTSLAVEALLHAARSSETEG